MSKKVSGRRFLGCTGGAVLIVLALGLEAAQVPPRPPTDLLVFSQQSSKPVLAPSDFTYLGSYDVQLNGTDSPYGQGLTSRYMAGDFRLLTIDYDSNTGGSAYIREFSLAGKSYGDLIDTPTNLWASAWGSGNYSMVGWFFGLWWDAAHNRLWTTHGPDYTAINYPVDIYVRTLNDNGTVSNVVGPVGLSGLPAKRVFGGAQPVPLWFQQQYGVGPYVVGWGGYTSLVAEGGVASMGPTMYAIPDPASYGGREVPVASYKTLMDNFGGTVNRDWYPSGSPTSYDRGSRLTIPINYFDGGDPRENPTTPPTLPPLSSSQWLSPSPDGAGRFTWGDAYYNTGQWIDGPNKQGFIAIASLCGGRGYYMSSSLHYDSRVFELHVFDSAKLGEAAIGARPIWKVKPSSMTQLTLPGLGATGLGGDSPLGNIGGATYDPSTKRLYLLGMGVNSYYNRLYVFQVNS
jgi:hypothetical protein